MNKAHKKLFAVSIFGVMTLPLFAQGVMPAGMNSLAENILGIFTGPFIRTLLAIFLCGAAIAYGFNKDNEKIKRNAIAIGISAGILISASAIVGSVWTASGG